MTTERKKETNRRNAKASTGPKTKLGKSRVKENARRHGLSISIVSAERSAEIEDLALRIAGETAEAGMTELARNIASAQIDLVRIRRARHDLLSRELDAPEYLPKSFFKDAREVVKYLVHLLRTSGPDAVVPPEMQQFVDHVFYSRPQGVEKIKHVLFDLSPELMRIDRYERRALSRRKFAIRAFDAARSQAGRLSALQIPVGRATKSMSAL
jgi:hypothetical protein